MEEEAASSSHRRLFDGGIEKTAGQLNRRFLGQIGHTQAVFPRHPASAPITNHSGIFYLERHRQRGLPSKRFNQFRVRHGPSYNTSCDSRQAFFYVKPKPKEAWVFLTMPRMSRSDQFKRECGERLSAARKAAGITQATAASVAGTTQSAWANWENGIRLPDTQAFAKIATRYGITYDWVFRGSVIGLPAELTAKLMARQA